MACFHPLVARRLPDPADPSKFKVCVEGSYAGPEAYEHLPPGEVMLLPCGQCVFCRLRRSLEWTIRCCHEQQMCGGYGSFLTLTFDDAHVPKLKNGLLTLDHVPFQKFMKRLRKRFPEHRFRYLMCGEYGSTTFRPHYHCILFGFRFDDAVSFGSERYFRSATLEELWTDGYSLIGNVTPRSIGYVCRYNLKKVTGKQAAAYYKGRMPDYIRMSLKPGIGAGWLSKFSGDIYKVDLLTDQVLQDAVRFQGRLSRPPRYYDKLMSGLDQQIWEAIQLAREEYAECQEFPAIRELLNREQHAQYVARMALMEKSLRDRAEGRKRI